MELTLAVVLATTTMLPARAAAATTASFAATVQEGDTIALTLEEALAIAEANNPSYRQAVNQLDVGGVQTRATWMNSILPRVSLSVLSTGFNGNLQRQATDFFGNPIENPQSEWSYSSRTDQSLNLSWSFQGKSLFNDLETLELDERGRELDITQASRNTGTQVRRQYYAILQERELLESEIASLATVERDLESARRLYEYVVAGQDRIAILNAELAVATQRRQIQQQERALDQARLALRTTLGDPDLPPFRLEPVALPVFDPGELDAQALVESALAAHPDIRQSELGVEQATLQVSQSRNTRWPDISFSYRLGRSSFERGDGGALFDVSHNSEDLSNSFGINLSVPYFTNYFGNRQSEVQAEVNLRNQREAMRQTRLQVEQQVRSQLVALRNQYETLLANQRSQEIAQEALDLTRERYRLGTLDFDDLDNQVEAERDARLQVISARYGFADALLNLEEAVGAPVRGQPPVTDGSTGGGLTGGFAAPGETGASGGPVGSGR